MKYRKAIIFIVALLIMPINDYAQNSEQNNEQNNAIVKPDKDNKDNKDNKDDDFDLKEFAIILGIIGSSISVVGGMLTLAYKLVVSSNVSDEKLRKSPYIDEFKERYDEFIKKNVNKIEFNESNIRKINDLTNSMKFNLESKFKELDTKLSQIIKDAEKIKDIENNQEKIMEKMKKMEKDIASLNEDVVLITNEILEIIK